MNQFGYYELRKKNTQEERKQNFEMEYFQNYQGQTYYKEYPKEELDNIRTKLEERAYVIEHNLEKNGILPEKYSMLDIGCGEGFLLQFFHDRNVQVKGIDFGSYALEYFHPQMLSFFEQGDMETMIPRMEKQHIKFDVVNMDRVLDMVLDPGLCLDELNGIMHEKSILVIKVANNYSNIQRMLLESGEMKEEYWIDDPDHTGYFNREGLIALLDAHGYECVDFYADTFVDLNLLNPLTNYYEHPATGKMVHKSAVRLENMLHGISMERTVDIYRMLADMGFGREIIGVFHKRGE